jgi:hypothetical protein
LNKGFPRPRLEDKPLAYSGQDDKHGVLSDARHGECIDQKLCLVCGLKLPKKCYILHLVESQKTLTATDRGGLHRACVRISLKHCPHFTLERVYHGPTEDLSKHQLTKELWNKVKDL